MVSSRSPFAPLLLFILAIFGSHLMAQGTASWETAQYQNVTQTRSEDLSELRGVNFLSLAGRSQIFIRLDTEVRYTRGSLAGPPRVFFDLEDTILAPGVAERVEIEDGLVEQVRIGQFREDVVRVVIDLAQTGLETTVASGPPQMLVEVREAGEEGAAQRAEESRADGEPGDGASAESEEAVSVAPRGSIQQSETPPSAPQVQVTTPAPSPDTEARSEPARIYAVQVNSQEDRTEVFVGVQRSVRFNRGRLENPARLYFDLRNTRLGSSVKRQIEVGDGRVRVVRLGQYQRATSRVVVEVDPETVHRVEFRDSPPGLLVEIVRPGLPKQSHGEQLGRVKETVPPAGEEPRPETAPERRDTLVEEEIEEKKAETREVQAEKRGKIVETEELAEAEREQAQSTEKKEAPKAEELQVITGRIPARRPGEAPPADEKGPKKEEAVSDVRVITGRIPTQRPGERTEERIEEKPFPTPYDEGEVQADEVEARLDGPPARAGTEAQPGLIIRAMPAAIEIPKVSRPPEIEDFLQGRPREAEAVITDFRQRSPGDGIPASEETTTYLSYDEDNFYAVFVCRDDSGDIRAQMSKREQIGGDDTVSLYLDTFFDQRRSFIFSANPYGVQRDGVLTEGQGSDFKFDTLWYAEGRFTREGYVVWMKIPFKSLRFPQATAQTWGIAVGRFIQRRQETSYWPYITRRVEGFVQQLVTLRGLNTISPGRNIEAIPYTTYTNSRSLTGQPDGTLGYSTEDQFDGGVDVKTVFRDSITLDLTANPDFSQVESDAPQVTINRRFEVFFPEKRPFFIENADFFQTPEQLFFSRRIIDPQFGARLTGRVGDWRVGLLAMDDEAPGKLVSETNPNSGKRAANAVLRFQRDFGDQSNVGILYTSRDFASTSNRVFGLDTRLKINPNWFFSGQVAGSQTRNPDGSKLEDPLYLAQLTHSGTHVQFSTRFLDRAPDFRSQLGFIQRVDIRQVDSFYQYLWYPEQSIVIDLGPTLSALANWDREGNLQDWYVNGGFRMDLLGPVNLEVNRFESMTLYEGIEFRNGLTDLSLFTGFNWIDFFVSYGQGGGINFNPGAGSRPFRAEAQNASVFVGVRPSSQLSIDATYIFSALRARENEFPTNTPQSVTIFNNHLVRWRTNYQFNRELSLRAILDYNSIIPNSDLVFLDRDKFMTFDILLTYLLNPGTALYLGYTNRYWNIDLDPTQPFGYSRTSFPDTSTSRQFFVKISRLFRF